MDELNRPVENTDSKPDSPAFKGRQVPEMLPSGNDPAMLREISGWNWGACVLTWIWLFAFGMHFWGIIVLVTSCTVPFANLIASIVRGMQGNKLAWSNRNFRDFQEYRKSMGDWNYAGIVILIATTVVALVGMAIALYYYIKTMKTVFPNGF